jgi:hypothetical protein
MQWFDVFYPTKDITNWTVEVVELLNKMTQWAKFNKNFQKEGTINTMDGRNGLKPYFPNKKSRHFMDSKQNECVPFVRYEQSRWLWCGV